jgi:hypothetical protein
MEGFIIIIPKSWREDASVLAKSADFPSLNAMLLDALDMMFDLPKQSLRNEWF